ncbi:MAG: thioredoxin family protein [Planctomycetia bacterium]|nr:thioredoxin family protein [Planctomycetia bacterium]
MRTRWFALVLSFSLLSGLTARIAVAELTAASVWGHDFAAAEAEATRLKRPLVIHFGATYCPPCRRMEKEVLHTPQVLKTLDAGFVAVKVDLPSNPALQKRFNVQSMPTDVILSPDGRVLARAEGYDGAAATKQKYVNNLTKIDNQYAAAGTRLPRTAAGAVDQKLPSIPAIPDRALAGNDKLVPQPTEPRKVDVPGDSVPGVTPPADGEIDRTVPPEFPEIIVAMDGYCPVTLRTSRTWKTGNKDFATEYDGQVFYFTAAEKMQEFKANPERFAPRLLGCDPVVLAESDLAIRGSTKFGAYYEGSLFLFQTAESRARFKKTPQRYSQLKHVLRPEDVKRVASNSDK